MASLAALPPAAYTSHSRLFLKVQPIGEGKTEIKAAARIKLDGAGGLLLLDSCGRTRERIVLNEVSISQMIWV